MEEIFKEILDNPYYAAVVVFISQIVFIYLRTLNVIYTSEKRIWPAIWTGNGVGISILISFAIGTKSVLGGELIPLFMFLLGGSLGTYYGVRQTIKKENKKQKNI